MAGELELGSIVMRIRADASGVKEGVAQAEREMGRLTQSTQKTGAGVDAAAKGIGDTYTKMGQSAQASAAAQAAAAATMSAAATKALKVIVGAIATGIDAINKYRAAMIGLESVASGRGINASAMEAALGKVTDAFFDVGAASTAFKNLLSRGYNLDQATQSILNLKDAAAFGRQASLGLAEAVVSATEGLKNENSILVDNAGVTKNVSKMWEDYAKSIGVGVMSLTTAQKIQAETLGIMTETRFQTGDMIKLQTTLAGTQAEAALSAEQLARAYGESMSPAVQLVTELWGGFLGGLTQAVQAFPGVIAGATAAGLAIGGFVVVQKAAAAFQLFKVALMQATGGVAAFGVAVNTALPWMAAIAAVIGIATAAYTQLSKEASDAAAAAEEQNKAAEERRRTIDAEVSSLTTLRDRYGELAKKSTLTKEQSAELLEIEKTLEAQFGITIGLLSSLSGGYSDVTGKINEQIAAKLKLTEAERQQDWHLAGAKLRELENQYDSSFNILMIQGKWQELLQEMASYSQLEQSARDRADFVNVKYYAQKYEDAKASLEKILASVGLSLESDFQSAIDTANAELDAASNGLDAARKDYIEKSLQFAEDAQIAAGNSINSSTAAVVKDFYRQLLNDNPDMNLNNFWSQYASALRQADTGPALQAMQDMQQRIMAGGLPKAEDLGTLTNAYNAAVKIVREAGQVMNATEDQMIGMMGFIAPAFKDVFSGVKELTDVLGDLGEQSITAVTQQAPEALSAWVGDATENARKDISDLAKLVQDAKKQADIVKGLNFVSINWDKKDSEGFRLGMALLTEYGETVPSSLAGVNAEYENHSKILKGAFIELSQMLGGMRSTVDTIKQYRDALDENSTSYKLLDSLVAELETSFRDVASTITPELPLDPSKYVSDLKEIDKSFEGLGKTAESTFSEMQSLAAKVASDSKLQSALGQLKTEIEGGRGTGVLAESLREHIRGTAEYANAALTNITDVNAAIDTTATRLQGYTGETELLTASIDTLYNDLLEGQKQFTEGSAQYKVFEGLITQIGQWKAAIADAGTATFKAPVELELKGGAAVMKQVEDLGKKAAATQKSIENIGFKRSQVADAKKLVTEAQRLEKTGKSAGDAWRKGVSDAIGSDFKGSLDEASGALDNWDLSLQGAIDRYTAEIETFKQQLSDMATGVAVGTIDVTVDGTVNVSPIIGAINAAIGIINAGLATLGASPLTSATGTTSRGGGGGGGKKYEGNSGFKVAIDSLEYQVSMGRKSLQGELNALLALQKKYKGLLNAEETRDLNKRIYDAQEAVRQASLQKDLDVLEHKRNMGRLSLAAEVIALQKILKAHKLNAEERRDVIEQLNAAQEALRQERLNKELRRISYLTTVEKMTTAGEIKALKAVLAKHKLTTDERMGLEEQLFAARERLRSDALAWDLALLDHQVAMGQSSAQQEIARLVDIKNAHVLTAEEVMQIDERIYRLQNQRIQESVNKTKTAYDQIVSALKNRLSEQKRLEDAALDDRIDALNELTRAENEAVKIDDYARSLADKQRELSVEKSARRRRELMEEIAKMEAAEALRQTQAARQEEIDAITAQKNAIAERYAQLTSEENIRQEALRLVMSSNLQEMTDLIASYGNQWQDAGAQLAQALSDGLLGNSSTITNTIEQLNEAIQTSINDQLSAMGRSIPNTLGTGGVVINMYGLTVRENADIDGIAGTLYDRIQAAGR